MAALGHEEADRVPVHPRFNDMTFLREFGVPRQNLPGNWMDQVREWLGVDDIIYGTGLDPPRKEDLEYEVNTQIVARHTDYYVTLTEYVTPAGTLRRRVRHGYYDADKIEEQSKDLEKDLGALKYLWRCNHEKRSTKQAEEESRKAVGEEKGVLLGGGGSAWNVLFEALGMVNLVLTAYKQPDVIREALEAAHEDLMHETRVMLEKIDVDIISLGAHAPTYLSPQMFDKFVFSYGKEMARLAREYGVHTIYHLDGKGSRMIEKLRDMGTTVLETIDPPPLGDFNMADAKKRVGNDICFLGGVDSMTIWKDTPKDVEKLTVKLMAEGAPGGGLIAGTGDSPPIGTPLANVQALVKTAKKVGFYPMRR